MKKIFYTYLSRFSVLFFCGFSMLIACNETHETPQAILRKSPIIIRQKIVYAAQSEPMATAQVESSNVSLDVLETKTKQSESSIDNKSLSTDTDTQKASSFSTSSVLASTSSKKNDLAKHHQPFAPSVPSDLTSPSVPSDITSPSVPSAPSKEKTVALPRKGHSTDTSLSTTDETDMALVLKKLAPKPFQYRPQGKIDPFVPLIVKKKRMVDVSQSVKKAVRKKRKRILTLLEKFDLSQLKLTAVMMTPKSTIAIVEETSGRGFVVKTGTRIGLNSGRVVDILMDRIIIQEFEEIITGKKLYITKEMKLNKPDSEF
ncbi:Pilus assembly protein PilP [Candidatus Magnetomorum sp. HK-1]|nr:Pilus assembly protein PilP [Candidatus Magnetomorum sp. HK-1]